MTKTVDDQILEILGKNIEVSFTVFELARLLNLASDRGQVSTSLQRLKKAKKVFSPRPMWWRLA